MGLNDNAHETSYEKAKRESDALRASVPVAVREEYERYVEGVDITCPPRFFKSWYEDCWMPKHCNSSSPAREPNINDDLNEICAECGKSLGDHYGLEFRCTISTFQFKRNINETNI